MYGKVWEKFTTNGEEFTMEAVPLESYFNDIIKKPFEDWLNAACLRGYVGSWEVMDNKLFLTNLVAYGDTDPKVNLQFIFPNQKTVFANWFTGELKICSGKIIQFCQKGTDDALYEHEMTFTFAGGLLKKKLSLKHIHVKAKKGGFFPSSFDTEVLEDYSVRND